MILVDSSIWFDSFRRSPGPAGKELRRMIAESEPFALTGIIVAEVLQGLTRDPQVIEKFLTQWDMLEPMGFQTYRTAATIFRTARGKGISLTTIDTLIATIALENHCSVFTLDQDFSGIASIIGLVLYRF